MILFLDGTAWDDEGAEQGNNLPSGKYQEQGLISYRHNYFLP